MKTLIYCFKDGILLELGIGAYPLFSEFIWSNFKQNDPIFLDGVLFGTFDFLNAEAGTNLQIVSINI